MPIYHSVTELIGRTPLLELCNYERNHDLKAVLLAKLECMNPAGSAKDRVAANMIARAETEGRLAPGGAACVPAGVQCGAGHLLEERRGGGGHRPARRQHRRRPLSGEDHPLYRGAVCMDLRHHPVERGI